MHLSRALPFVAVAVVSLLASVTAAQTPPDAVRLRGGGLVRGTIIEHLPSGPVRIQLLTGEERRIESDQVEWAGPAAEMPTPETPEAAGAREEVPPVIVGPLPATSPGVPDSPPQYDQPVTVQDPMALRAPGMAATALPGTPVATGVVSIRFESDREDVRVDAQIGTNSFMQYGHTSGSGYGYGNSGGFTMARVVERPVWRQLCVAPCTQEFAAGRVQIGVALESGGRTYRVPQVVTATEPSVVRIHWGDRYDLRVGGAVGWALVGAGGTGMMVPGIIGLYGNSLQGEALGLFIAGAVTVGISTIVGLILTMLDDELSLEQEPL